MEEKAIQSKLRYIAEISKLQEFFAKHEIEAPLKNNDYGLALNDPNENRIVGSHYGLSHYTAGLIILSHTSDDNNRRPSYELYLKYVEATNQKYTKQNDYHHDFNNFAWALLLLINYEIKGFLSEQLKFRLSTLLMNTPDSVHDTINWISMRALNNFVRYHISGEKAFLKKSYSLLSKISKAQNKDGMYDDFLPVGLSGNIQYHVYTTAVLQLIRHFELGNGGGNIQDALSFTIKTIDPEGDFNYFGRGTNQLFGWGPFFFNLEGTNSAKKIRDKCKTFFKKNLNLCLANNGLLLENSSSDQKNYWWDYHYSTVYSAHLFFWLNLLHIIIPREYKIKKNINKSNIDITSTESGFCSIFKGKSYYLCERGPQLCNIWTKKNGSLFKGPFGSFFDYYGTNHISKSSVIMNYFGPIIEYPTNFIHRLDKPFFRKLHDKIIKSTKYKVQSGIVLKPSFPSILESEILNDKVIEITYKLTKQKFPVIINIPLFMATPFSDLKTILEVEFDGISVELFHVGSAYGLYGKFELFRSQSKSNIRTIKVFINLT
jgi:hypothetical protein